MLTSAEMVTEALLDGRYRLQEPVGTGGMATVYRAADVVLGRTVAIKMIRQDGTDMAPVERAHLEESALASLDHPGIVTLFDSRLAPGRAQYLVLEFVHGPTLRSVLAQERMPPAEVAVLAAELADALRAVHEAGLVHSDLTPSNIILRPARRTGGTASPVIVDFGISTIVGDPRLTSPGIVLGTLSYIAPELLRGAEATSAVDVYALGLVLIEALSGRPAYAPGEGVESALVRLSSPPELPEDLPTGWHALLRRMTSIDPDARPSAAEAGRILKTMDASASPAASTTAPTATSTPRATASTTPTAPTAVITAPPRARSPRDGSRRVRRTRRRSALMLRTALGLTAVGALSIGAVLTAPVEAVGRNSEDLISRTSPSTVIEQVSEESPFPTEPDVDPASEQTASVPEEEQPGSNGKKPDHAHSPGGEDRNNGNNGNNANNGNGNGNGDKGSTPNGKG